MTSQEPETGSNSSSVQRLFWASAAFYVLIAFEFFYMASPFAAYFYAVYGPGMDWLQGLDLANWTLWFFLPHMVEETRSPLINHAETTGLILFFGGLLVFAVGAFQVYRAKLRKADAVTGGLYRFIRHPQYTALIVASIGMLLIWPRFLVLFSTILVVFAYVALARAEEAICLRQYPNYAEYQARTGMFLPEGWLPLPRFEIGNGWAKAAVWTAGLVIVFGVTTAAAFGLRHLAIVSLYTHQTHEGVYLSIVGMSDADLAESARIARGTPATEAALQGLTENDRLLAYVLPTGMYVSEIPMHLPAGEQFGHSIPRDRDPTRNKVIFTRAEFGAERLPQGGGILAHAVNKRPLIEVHVDLTSGTVEATYPPPADAYYDGHQVPIF